MFSTGDTIVAVATPPGRGSIGVVRLSGPGAKAIAESLVGSRLEARHATVAHLQHDDDVIPDQVVCTWFAGPHSYTGEDVVEISTHGNPVVLDRLVAAGLSRGARHAMPGEFTFRAFLNGRIDLVQAEAVADLIEAATPTQARAACDQLDGTLSGAIGELEAALFELIARLEASLDFPDEGFHFIAPGEVTEKLAGVITSLDSLLADAASGRVLRDGARVVFAGRPNAGKSSLFNALLRSERAIVAPHPGTTRDVVSATFDVGGVPCELVDTAGIHEGGDAVEREGMRRGAAARQGADACVVVVDGSAALAAADRLVLRETASMSRVIAVNKADLGVCASVTEELGSQDHGIFEGDASPLSVHDASAIGRTATTEVVVVSAMTGRGVDALREAIGRALGARRDVVEVPRVTNRRHADALDRARAHVKCAVVAMQSGATEEFALVDLRLAVEALQSVSGRRAPDAVLTEIFSRFCIGK